MESQRSDLSPSVDFVSSGHRSHKAVGVYSTINVARTILSLRGTLINMSKGNWARFHVSERTLYSPLRESLQSLLPVPGAVDVEIVLKRLRNPALRTDISIRDLCEITRERLDDFGSSCFVELKSVFHGERLSAKDVEDDLKKLVECQSVYSAKCFFVLVGLESDLRHSPSALDVLGSPGNDVREFNVELSGGETIWLQPAGKAVDDELRIYVWCVSAANDFARGSMSCSYTVFQSIL